MSWDQDYSIPSVETILEKLTGNTGLTLLIWELKNQGIEITMEEVVLDDGFYGPVKGTKVTLSDGRVFIPKLVEKFNENGNHGVDIYEYRLEGETPEVMCIGLDSSDPDVDEYTVPENYGQTDNENIGC